MTGGDQSHHWNSMKSGLRLRACGYLRTLSGSSPHLARIPKPCGFWSWEGWVMGWFPSPLLGSTAKATHAWECGKLGVRFIPHFKTKCAKCLRPWKNDFLKSYLISHNISEEISNIETPVFYLFISEQNKKYKIKCIFSPSLLFLLHSTLPQLSAS